MRTYDLGRYSPDFFKGERNGALKRHLVLKEWLMYRFDRPRCRQGPSMWIFPSCQRFPSCISSSTTFRREVEASNCCSVFCFKSQTAWIVFLYVPLIRNGTISNIRSPFRRLFAVIGVSRTRYTVSSYVPLFTRSTMQLMYVSCASLGYPKEVLLKCSQGGKSQLEHNNLWFAILPSCFRPEHI